jgi:hypothetical protein
MEVVGFISFVALFPDTLPPVLAGLMVSWTKFCVRILLFMIVSAVAEGTATRTPAPNKNNKITEITHTHTHTHTYIYIYIYIYMVRLTEILSYLTCDRVKGKEREENNGGCFY